MSEYFSHVFLKVLLDSHHSFAKEYELQPFFSWKSPVDFTDHNLIASFPQSLLCPSNQPQKKIH